MNCFRSEGAWLPWAVLGIVVLVGTPLYLCMPPWVDVVHYDICARNILRGGTHYKDIFDTNPPGMVWLHAGVRLLLGWSYLVLHVVDLLVIAGIIWQLQTFLPRQQGTAPRVWLACCILLLYFQTPESAQIQRDVWMLLPCLVALRLRLRQVEAPQATSWWVPFLEGVCWAGTAGSSHLLWFPLSSAGL